MEKLYIGTAGWSYKDWIDSFYPAAQTKNFDWLQFYASYFNMVEVNSSYYTYLAPRTVEGWINKVEEQDDFLFTIKLHQDFTHKRNYKSEQIFAVKNVLDKLNNANRFGGLLLQFPYSFSLNKENATYVKTLFEVFEDYEKFIEVRHKSWLIERFFNFAAKSNCALCAVDQPNIGEAVELKPYKTNDTLYVRLHGRNEAGWKQSISNFNKEQSYEQQSQRYEYLYSPGELLEIERIIKEVYDTVKKVFIIFNNHPHGNAVANAFEMLHNLKERISINIPQTTLSAYPRLSKIALH